MKIFDQFSEAKSSTQFFQKKTEVNFLRKIENQKQNHQLNLLKKKTEVSFSQKTDELQFFFFFENHSANSLSNFLFAFENHFFKLFNFFFDV